MRRTFRLSWIGPVASRLITKERTVKNHTTTPIVLALLVVLFASPASSAQGVIFVTGNKVGVGTDTPTETLHVRGTSGTSKILVEEASSTATGRNLFKIENNGAVRFDLTDNSTSRTWRFANGGTNFSILDLADPFVVEFQLGNNGNLTISGQLTTGGTTCGGGGCDLVFDSATEVESIQDHAAQMWARGYLPAVGPTKEGAPFNLTEKTGGILNELEKAHVYIEQLADQLADRDSQIAELREALQDLAKRQAELEESLPHHLPKNEAGGGSDD